MLYNPNVHSRAFGTELSNIPRQDDPPLLKRKQVSFIQNSSKSQIQESINTNFKCPQEILPYQNEIFKYLKETENQNTSNMTGMEHQKDINEKMRGILVDWLVDVHLKFKLRPETLFVTVNIVDRYLAKAQINRQKLQLVGITAMLIASKYEEIYAPELKDFIYVTDHAYQRDEVLQMEGLILAALDFNLTFPTPLSFLEKTAQIANFDKKMTMLARYLLELALIELKMNKYSSSNIAFSAVYLVNKIRKKEGWNAALVSFSKMQEIEIRKCAKELCILLQNCEKSCLQAVRKKFSLAMFFEVGKIRLEKN